MISPHTVQQLVYSFPYYEFRIVMLFTVLLLLVRFFPNYNAKTKYPPGPKGIPVFGFLPFLRKNLYLQLTEMAKTYGEVFHLYFGRRHVVVLSKYDAIKEAFSNKEFSARPSSGLNEILDGYGIINSDGKLWQSHRNFIILQLRKFGVFQHRKMEANIMKEVKYFLNNLAHLEKTAADLNLILSTSITNVISEFLMSVKFSKDSREFEKFHRLMDEGFKLFSTTQIVNYIPIFKYVPYVNKAYRKLVENKEEVFEFIKEIICRHKETFDPNCIRDFVDAYLKEISTLNGHAKNNGFFASKDPEKQLCQVVIDLFTAGQETIKTTILWAILLLLKHPHVYHHVQKELDEVIGSDRLPRYEDITCLPFTEATILEVMRRYTAVPLGTVHATTRSIQLHEYEIEKDSYVIPLIWAVHMDESLWDKPEDFEPRRFLTPEGRICKPKWFIPFGVGRRMCLGDTLAKMEIFLFLSSLLHAFDIVRASEIEFQDLKAEFGATLKPLPFKVKCIPRNIPHIIKNGSFEKDNSTLIKVLL